MHLSAPPREIGLFTIILSRKKIFGSRGAAHSDAWWPTIHGRNRGCCIQTGVVLSRCSSDPMPKDLSMSFIDDLSMSFLDAEILVQEQAKSQERGCPFPGDVFLSRLRLRSAGSA